MSRLYMYMHAIDSLQLICKPETNKSLILILPLLEYLSWNITRPHESRPHLLRMTKSQDPDGAVL